MRALKSLELLVKNIDPEVPPENQLNFLGVGFRNTFFKEGILSGFSILYYCQSVGSGAVALALLGNSLTAQILRLFPGSMEAETLRVESNN